MARVNVDETVYASIPIIQSYTGWSYASIIGHLVLLWRFSQDALRISGTAEEICDWAWVTKDENIFIKGLLKGKFIRELPCPCETDDSSMLVASASIQSPSYLICGNEKHVAAHRVFKKRAKKAAAARWENYLDEGGKKGEIPDQSSENDKERRGNDASSHASSIENEASSMLNDACVMLDDAWLCPIQYNSIQNNSVQDNSNQSKEKKKRRKKHGIGIEYTNDFEQVWVAYERKGDKKAGFKVFTDLDLSIPEFDSLLVAIKNYKIEKPERKYRKDLERFLTTDWREQLTPLPELRIINGGQKTKDQLVREANNTFFKKAFEKLAIEGGEAQ